MTEPRAREHKTLRRQGESGMTDKASVVKLHDRITVTFSPGITKLLKAEIERQRKVYAPDRVQTPDELAEMCVRFHCESMVTD